MWLIIALLILGALLLVAEIVLLPGFTIAGIGGFISYGIAIYLGFSNYGTTGGVLAIAGVVVISVLAITLSLRAKTWQRLSLKSNIDSTSHELPEKELAVGERGVAVTRLAPLGKAMINGNTFEARSLGDLYLDQKTEVEVVGFDNFTVIVQKVEK